MGPIALALLVVVLLIGIAFTSIASAVRARSDARALTMFTLGAIVVTAVLAGMTIGLGWSMAVVPGMIAAALAIERHARRDSATSSVTMALMLYIGVAIAFTLWIVQGSFPMT